MKSVSLQKGESPQVKNKELEKDVPQLKKLVSLNCDSEGLGSGGERKNGESPSTTHLRVREEGERKTSSRQQGKSVTGKLKGLGRQLILKTQPGLGKMGPNQSQPGRRH